MKGNETDYVKGLRVLGLLNESAPDDLRQDDAFAFTVLKRLFEYDMRYPIGHGLELFYSAMTDDGDDPTTALYYCVESLGAKEPT